MPINKQIRFAVGAQYDWSKNINVGRAFVCADYGDAKIKDPLLAIDYKCFIHRPAAVVLSRNYRFSLMTASKI